MTHTRMKRVRFSQSKSYRGTIRNTFWVANEEKYLAEIGIEAKINAVLTSLMATVFFFCFIAIKMKKKHERIHYTTGIGIQVPIGVNKNHCYRNFVYCSCSLRYWISCRRADRLKLSDHRLHPIFFFWIVCGFLVPFRTEPKKEKKRKRKRGKNPVNEFR